MRNLKISDEKLDAFKRDLLEVVERHQLTVSHFYIQYDEYDSDEGFEVVKIEDIDGLTPWRIKLL